MPSNPLSEICRTLCIHDTALATAMGASARDVATAMIAEPPAGSTLALFLQIANLLKLKITVRGAPGLSFRVSTRLIDALLFDAEYRAAERMLAAPRTRGGLRAMVIKLNKAQGPEKAARALQANYVPTVTGKFEWRRSTVAQHAKLGHAKLGGVFADDGEEIVPEPEMREAWRREVVGRLLGAMCPLDSFAQARYGFEPHFESGVGPGVEHGVVRVTCREARLPLCVRESIEATLRAAPFFTDAIEIDGPENPVAQRPA